MEQSKKVPPANKLTKEGEEKTKDETPLEKADADELAKRNILSIKKPPETKDNSAAKADSKEKPEAGKNSLEAGKADADKKENETKISLPFSFPAPSKPLFGDLFAKSGDETSAPALGGLFGKPATEGSAEQKPGAFGLFSNLSGGSLFGSSQAKESSQQGIFKDFYASGNMFGKSSNGFADKKNSDGEGSGAEEEEGGEYQQEKSEDEETIKKRVKDPYKYETFHDTVIRKEIANFKVDESDSFGPGSAAIEQSHENKEIFRFVMRNKTKNVLFNGVLVKNLSHCVVMKNKPGISFFAFVRIAEAAQKPGENKQTGAVSSDKSSAQEKPTQESEAAQPKADANSTKKPENAEGEKKEKKAEEKSASKLVKKNVKVLFNSEEDAKLFKEKIDTI